jgi:hypothetical protein
MCAMNNRGGKCGLFYKTMMSTMKYFGRAEIFLADLWLLLLSRGLLAPLIAGRVGQIIFHLKKKLRRPHIFTCTATIEEIDPA